MATDVTSQAAIFERLVHSSEFPLSREAAESLLALDFSAEDHERMEVLAEKARQGTLTSDDQVAIENYERVGYCLDILRSKARQILRQP
jgi:hypothetical protein